MQSSILVLFFVLSALSFISATDILARVIQEQTMGRAYLDMMLHMTHGTYGSTAGSLIGATTQTFIAAHRDKANEQKHREVGNRLRLQAMFTAWKENKVATTMTIIGSEDVQKDYYMDRLVQLQMQALGNQVPPQLYSLVYMKFYLTYLKTMKFSQKYQVLAHFNTLYEDEIDVMTVVVAKNPNHEMILQEESPSLTKNKLWLFSTFSQFVQTDVTVFYLQYYLDYMTMALSGQNTGFPNMWQRMINLYTTMLTYMAAQNGLKGSILEKASAVSASKGELQRSDDEAVVSLTFFNQFSHCYRTASTIEYFMAFYSIYAMYAPYLAAQQQAVAAAQPAPAAQQPAATGP